jgi:peptidoglycan hydrolase-like protein with peptidoglycan-binding domain
LIGLGLLVTAGTVVAVSVIRPDTGSEPVEASLNTAEVIRTDLADETIYDATLGRPIAGELTAGIAGTVTWVPEAGTVVTSGDALFAIDEVPVLLVKGAVPAYRDFELGETNVIIPAGRAGVLTWLPDAGTIIVSGDVISRIDDTPTVVLEGDLPMYRTLREGVEGTDVQQLEQALVDLGFDPDGTVTIDDDFTSATESMVERWQEELGVEETGRTSAGDIIFAPLPAQVVSQQSAVGASVSPGTPILATSGGEFLSGSDVLQLEQALVDLGYDPGLADGVYDIDTARAVATWTNDGGHGQDGRLPVGSIVFNEGDLRIGEVFADVGAAAGPTSPVISAAGVETIVRLDLPAEDQGLLSVGSSVVIVMPDRSETTGTVTFVSSVATAGGQGNPTTFAVEIALSEPSVAEGLDEAPVDVRAVSEAVEDVLAVPVSALLALAEGGYAVELVDGGETSLVSVDPGFFADGWVEITGNVQVGDVVVVP